MFMRLTCTTEFSTVEECEIRLMSGLSGEEEKISLDQLGWCQWMGLRLIL
jgi:hypothetical protein